MQMVRRMKPTTIISVGDVVTRNLTKNRVPVHVMIIDNRALRHAIQPIEAEAQTTLHVKNPAGTITPQAWVTVKEALERNQTAKVLVDGEEDLLVLVAVMQAPLNSLVVYGQPHEGVVVIKVTSEARDRMQEILEAMQPAVEKPK